MHVIVSLHTCDLLLPCAAPPAAELGSFDDAVAAGRPVVVLQLYGAVEDGEALATAGDEAALVAVMAAADSPGSTLCVQPLQLSGEGATA